MYEICTCMLTYMYMYILIRPNLLNNNKKKKRKKTTKQQQQYLCQVTLFV